MQSDQRPTFTQVESAGSAAAVAATRKRLALWEKDARELAAVAKDFAACVPLAGSAAERADYVGLTIEALRRARAAGPADDLSAHPWPAEVRAHQEFAGLVPGK